MNMRSLTGSRIRERRMSLGLRQGDLAKSIGISASYLNLIEHNRRRIAGKLLTELARALSVEVTALTDGAEASKVAALQGAAASAEAAQLGVSLDTEQLEEIAGRFPTWADLIAQQHQKIRALNHIVDTLSDRLAHDPFLSTSLHDVITTVTSIRSSSSILAKEDELDPEWRKRFERNIFNDSRRLAESAQSLANYLDGAADASATLGSPQEEVDRVLEDRGFSFEALEGGAAPQGVVTSLIDEANLRSPQAAGLLRVVLQRYQQDAGLLPMSTLLKALDADLGGDAGQTQLNPVRLAARLQMPLEVVLRRLAHIPEGKAPFPMGLVICDASGTLIYRKPVAGFDVPRVGAPCALWPMFRALNQPMQPLRAVVQQVGASRPAMRAFAVSTPVVMGDFDRPAIYEATMLIAADTTAPPSEAEKVGPSCRICSVSECAVRREPSVLADTISAF